MKRTLLLILFLYSAFLQAQTYEVIEVEIECKPYEIEGVNTKGSDFSPFVFGEEFYFTSSREHDMHNFGENNWKNAGYLNVFTGKIKGDVNSEINIKNIDLVSNKIMTDNHTGPLSISSTGDTMFFTQVVVVDKKHKKKKKKYRPQLFMSIKIGKDWDTPTPLPFNDDRYSFGHPCFDSENKRLYFSSDMVGTKGGKDIFYVDIKQSVWGKPKNAEEINTSSNEMFPHLVDGIMFFASDKAGGKGGLDVYWRVNNQKLNDSKPVIGLNSIEDDFGMYVFKGMTKGFYSNSSKGNDDIYFFEMDKRVTIKNELAGQFTYRNLDGNPSKLKIMILNDDDELLFETTTDDKGKFKFNNIDYDGNYHIKAKTEDDLYLTIFDKDGNALVDLVTDENGAFTYKKLAFDKSGTLTLIPEDMIDMALNQGHLTAQFVFEKFPGEYPSQMKIMLENKEGEMKFTTFTDENGNFDFRKLDMTENYILKIPKNDRELILLIFDKKGNVVAQLKGNSDGQFVYRKLKPSYSNSLSVIDESEDMFVLESQTISGYFEYKNLKNEFENGLKVQAYNEDGLLLEETVTDKYGRFRFRNLPVEDNLLFKVDENDGNLELDNFTLYIYDRNGKRIAQLRRGQNDYFIFKPLGFDHDHDLTNIKEDSLNISIQTKYDIVTVYFDSNRSNAKSSDLSKLSKMYKLLKSNPNLKIEVNAYADANNSDEYNLILSSKRGDWLVDYFKKKGISKKRFIVNAYGEARLAHATDDALNRRAQIRIY